MIRSSVSIAVLPASVLDVEAKAPQGPRPHAATQLGLQKGGCASLVWAVVCA